MVKDEIFLETLHLDPNRQMIGAMCSGALILAALGLLAGKEATTYPRTRALIKESARFNEKLLEGAMTQAEPSKLGISR